MLKSKSKTFVGEHVIHRIPTHKISNFGFVQDDSLFYVFVQFGKCCFKKMFYQVFILLAKIK